MAQKSTTAATTTTPAEGVGPGKVFPPLDHTTFVPQLVWLAISFGLLYVLLKRVALPRVTEVIEERADRIRRDLEQAEKLKAETEGALAAYEQALTDARSKASGIIKTMRDGLTAEVDKERARVEAEIARKVADAEARIEQTKSRALASVNDIATETAGAIVKKLIGADVSPDELQKALVRRAAE
ncbi:MAG TPA: F0F1 ATP synthase subunit B [Hyphomicrobiaceae bacterium]|nr:F0F1 ATP synthase subunit B [Hyphomicrobiaceae bacterium]